MYDLLLNYLIAKYKEPGNDCEKVNKWRNRGFSIIISS